MNPLPDRSRERAQSTETRELEVSDSTVAVAVVVVAVVVAVVIVVVLDVVIVGCFFTIEEDTTSVPIPAIIEGRRCVRLTRSDMASGWQASGMKGMDKGVKGPPLSTY